MDLTDRDRAMLTLADTHYKFGGAKEAAMRDQFGVSSTVFWQRVGWLIRQPEALAWDARVVRRLGRLRDGRRRVRTAGRG